MCLGWIIKGATVVSGGTARQVDVKVAGGRIEDVGNGAVGRNCKEINATGKILFPGLIDDQVHYREPGLTHKGCIASESAAAVAGGVTSMLEMPNTCPATVDVSAFANKMEIAKRDSRGNYGFYLGATGENGDVLQEARSLGACGVKVFLGASTGNLLVEGQEALEQVFASVPDDMVLAAHCEDTVRIRKREMAILSEANKGDMSVHPVIRDEISCKKSTERAIDLATRHGTRLHVLHISTATELDLFEQADLSKKLVTAEACVHHLWFTDKDYETLQGRIKCNPAIKSSTDRDALRKALCDGRIDVVATDHAPHLLNEKRGTYKEVAAGLPLVEHSLLVLMDLVAEGHIQYTDVARLACENPARLFGIKDRGWIKEGMHADLVLVDPNKPSNTSDDTTRYKCGWTPFDGHTFHSSVEMVWVSGNLAFCKGNLVDHVRGLPLEYEAAVTVPGNTRQQQ